MQVASTKARTLMTKKYPDEYAKLYIKLRQEFPERNKSYAQSKAKSILVKKYYEEYKVIRQQVKLEGYPATYKKTKVKV